MLNGFYARLTTGITYCNQYLAMAGDTDATMSAEIRFVRALHYFLLMDGWGNIPFTLEPMTKPEQRSRAQMYEWLEQELIGIEPACLLAVALTPVLEFGNLYRNGPMAKSKRICRQSNKILLPAQYCGKRRMDCLSNVIHG